MIFKKNPFKVFIIGVGVILCSTCLMGMNYEYKRERVAMNEYNSELDSLQGEVVRLNNQISMYEKMIDRDAKIINNLTDDNKLLTIRSELNACPMCNSTDISVTDEESGISVSCNHCHTVVNCDEHLDTIDLDKPAKVWNNLHIKLLGYVN